MNHIEVLMEYKYMQQSLTQALTTLSVSNMLDFSKSNHMNICVYV